MRLLALGTVVLASLVMLVGCGDKSDSAPQANPNALKNAPNAKGVDAVASDAPTASAIPGATAPLEAGSKMKNK